MLDTNVALAWLLFADPQCDPLAAAIGRQHLRWLACLQMRDELAEVLVRGLAHQRGVAPEAVLARWDRHATLVAEPEANPAGMTCADPDDQVFIDLACGEGARWLVSRDRAVLHLARRARPLGLLIVPPAAWAPPAA